MDLNFKKARSVTFFAMAGLLACAAVAWFFSKPHGYGGSSEAKMNFLRLIVFVVSAVQIMMGATVKKIIAMGAVTGDKAKKLLAAQTVGNALCESPALFGLILVFMTKSFLDYGICAAISFVGLLLIFPKQNDWESASV